MSASTCVAFFGLRFDVHPDEIEGLESRSDPRMQAARKVGLKHYWANFGAPDSRYLLFIGQRIAILGPENDLEANLSPAELQSVIESTKEKLLVSGLNGTPALYLQWAEDL